MLMYFPFCYYGNDHYVDVFQMQRPMAHYPGLGAGHPLTGGHPLLGHYPGVAYPYMMPGDPYGLGMYSGFYPPYANPFALNMRFRGLAPNPGMLSFMFIHRFSDVMLLEFRSILKKNKIRVITDHLANGHMK